MVLVVIGMAFSKESFVEIAFIEHASVLIWLDQAIWLPSADKCDVRFGDWTPNFTTIYF